MQPLVTALYEALEGHIDTLHALVKASQHQQQAIISYRTVADESAQRVTESNEKISGLREQLQGSHEEAQMIATALRERLGLSLDEAPGLSSLARHFEAAMQEPILTQISCIRSLADAMTELQRLNQVHAQRGMQLLNAWRALLTHDTSGGRPQTYTSRGRNRVRPVEPYSLLLNV